MQIRVINVNTENKGKYTQATVNYEAEGKTDAKKLMSFVFKDVYKALAEAQPGDLFNIERVKNDKGYWDWTEATPAGKAAAGSGVVTKAVRSNFETPEERAARQVYIVRQSSIASAIALLKGPKADPSVDEVIDTARKLEAYVFENNTQQLSDEIEIS